MKSEKQIEFETIQEIKNIMIQEINKSLDYFDSIEFDYTPVLGIFITRDSLSNLDFFTLRDVWKYVTSNEWGREKIEQKKETRNFRKIRKRKLSKASYFRCIKKNC